MENKWRMNCYTYGLGGLPSNLCSRLHGFPGVAVATNYGATAGVFHVYQMPALSHLPYGAFVLFRQFAGQHFPYGRAVDPP